MLDDIGFNLMFMSHQYDMANSVAQFYHIITHTSVFAWLPATLLRVEVVNP